MRGAGLGRIPTGPKPMSVAAVILIRERWLVDRFRRAGATSPEAARTLAEVGADEGIALNRLSRRAVIREAKAGAYYLDEPTWTALRGTRRRLAAIVIGVGLLVAAASYVSWGR